MKAGRPRVFTDAQVERVKAWKPGDKPALYILAETMGMCPEYAYHLRGGRATRTRSDRK